mgnify:CR=1 FL=1
MLAVRINKGSFVSLELFQLDGSRGLGGDVVEDAVDAGDFVDDAGHAALENGPGEFGRLGGHEVAGQDGAEDDGHAVGPVVALDADGAHVGQGGKILAQRDIHACFVKLFAEYGVCLLDNLHFVGSDFSYDTDSQTRAGKRLAVDDVLRHPDYTAERAYFVLEQVS